MLTVLTRALGALAASRAVVFVLVGVFVLKAAVLSSASQAKELDAVFRPVASPAGGAWLLALAGGLTSCAGSAEPSAISRARSDSSRLRERAAPRSTSKASSVLIRSRSLAGTLISAVSQHEAAEEEYFWPAVKEKVVGRGSLAAGGIEQETEARKVLAELDGMAPGNPRFIPLMIQFNHTARAHIAYEEQRVWPDLRAALSPSEAGQLGEKLARAARPGSLGRTRIRRPARPC